MRLLPLFLTLLSMGCSRLETPERPKGPFEDLPLAAYSDTTLLTLHEGSQKRWVLKTLHLVKWPKSDLIQARPVELTLFDSLGEVAVSVVADSGAVDEPVNFLMCSGNVHGRSGKGLAIWTDSLRWNKAANQVSTDAKVKVVSEDGDTLSGVGFVSDAQLDHWRILSGVKGVFRKVEERVKAFDGPASDSAGASDGSGASASGTATPTAPLPEPTPAQTAPQEEDPFAMPGEEG